MLLWKVPTLSVAPDDWMETVVTDHSENLRRIVASALSRRTGASVEEWVVALDRLYERGLSVVDYDSLVESVESLVVVCDLAPSVAAMHLLKAWDAHEREQEDRHRIEEELKKTPRPPGPGA